MAKRKRGRPRKGERVLGPYRYKKRWRVQFVTYGPDGRENTDYYCKTESEAERLKAALELELRSGVGEAVSFAEAIDAYIEYQRKKGNKERTIEQSRYALRRFFELDQPVWSLRARWCQTKYEELTGQYSVDTHRNTLAQCKTFLEWCRKRRLIGENPLDEVEPVGKRSKGKEQLSAREARIWYDKAMAQAEAGDDRSLAALLTFIEGMCCSEIVMLRVEDLDDVHEPYDTIHIRDGKTKKRIRSLDVPPHLRPLLATQARDKHPKCWLFQSTRGHSGHHDRQWPRKQVNRICQEAKVKTVCAHSMRGLAATLAADRGEVWRKIADALGHEDIRTTRESYAKPGAGEKEKRRRLMTVLTGGKSQKSDS